MMYGGVAAPPGGKWALCNGAELESALYPALFAVIGAAYSLAGTPAGRFNLPNLTDRFGIGAGAVASLGKTGGSKDLIIPTHNHSINHAHPTGTTRERCGARALSRHDRSRTPDLRQYGVVNLPTTFMVPRWEAVVHDLRGRWISQSGERNHDPVCRPLRHRGSNH